MKKKYAVAGASSRALNMFLQPFEENAELGEIVALFSNNAKSAQQITGKVEGLSIPIYNDFDRMITEKKPDVVIVTTIDKLHHVYIIRAMELGCDVITEKPLTIDEEKANAILETKRKTGKNLTITFNFRFVPYNQKVKELISSGVIGDIKFVQLEYLNDYTHGSSYFRRWHGQLENSGSLLITKGTHYFDLVNWWINQQPTEVSAMGTQSIFGPKRQKRGERCLTCEHKDSCEYYWDITTDHFSTDLYLKTEKETGYIRDKCVFSEDNDIWDAMTVNVKYDGGALMSMSICVYAPYEGWRISFTGTKGRLEAEEFRTGAYSETDKQIIRVIHRDNSFEEHLVDKNEVKIEDDTGIANYTLLGHNGGDVVLRRMLFIGDVPDRHNQMAGIKDALSSLLTGVAAVKSIQNRKEIKISDLLEQEIIENS